MRVNPPAYLAKNALDKDGTKRVEYKEGIFVGYRGYEHNGVKPLFPFGYGLSYTSFKYSNLSADEHGVSFDVTNTGGRAGDAVLQVYVSAEHPSVPWPPQELKGFSRVSLRPRETKTVRVPFNTRSFASWQNGMWKAEKGEYEVLVGSSSEEIELTGRVTLQRDVVEK